MFDYLRKRLKEPSTYLGLGALTLGAGELFKIKEAGDIAGAIGAAGEAVTQGGEGGLVTGLALLVSGIAGAFLKEGR
ncbi:hypothetical protein [Pelagibius sp.]|uniref:hypothetical protein n=1 Tax=Pelagibius sp. TaxID=1931238 RepID=UPI002609B379|nr:hypothetical protein [Pelagibius sp.]